MPNTFLVTGGCGFIGSHIVDELLNRYPEDNIVIIDNLSSGQNINTNKRVLTHTCSLDNLFSLRNEYDLSWAKDIKYIFHLAAQIDLRKSMNHPFLDTEQDITGFVKMMEYFKSIDRLKELTVVFSSTGGAMYSGYLPECGYKEGCVASPLSPYGINKFTIEKYLEYYHAL